MNSLDPWRLIVTDPDGNVLVPSATYGHPFYREVPSWIHYGGGGGTTRELFDGAFISGWIDSTGDNMTNHIGAELTALSAPGYGFIQPFGGGYYRPYGGFYRPYGGVFFGADVPLARQGLTAELAPVVAPATGGITVKKELDDKQILHVEICVDGKCYRSSMDLAPAISMVMQKLARWHEGQHAAQQAPPSTVVSTVESAVGAAEDLIVGALVARHVDTVCGSWLGDIANAVSGAVSGIGGGVASTFKKLKGPIAAAAGVAAAAGAAAIPGVGIIAAPIAGKLANDLVNAAAGDDSSKKTVQQATQQAQTDPTVAVALQQAKKAVANSTAAYHVQETAKKAAAGDATAQQHIAQVATDAQQGDPAAKAVADLVTNAMHSQWGADLWQNVTGRGPDTVSGWYDIVGADVTIVGGFWDSVKDAVLTVTLIKPTNQFIKDNHLEPYVKMAASAVATAYGGPAAGAAAGALSPMVMNLGVDDKKQAATASKNVEGVKATAQRQGRQLGQAVEVAHGAIEQTATAYQVAQLAKDAKAGVPEAQHAVANLQAAAGRGDQNATKALQAIATIDSAQQQSPGAVAGWHQIAGVVIGMAGMGACSSYDASVGCVHGTTIGASLSDVRSRAQTLANAKAGAAVGVIHSKRDNAWYIYAFGSLDDAIDWLQQSTQDRATFTYAAVYEKGADGTAFAQAEEVGGSRRPTAPPAEQIRRGIATAGGWWS